MYCISSENSIMTHDWSLTNIGFFPQRKKLSRDSSTPRVINVIKNVWFLKLPYFKKPNPLSGRNELEKEECIKEGTKRYQKSNLLFWNFFDTKLTHSEKLKINLIIILESPGGGGLKQHLN